MAMLVPNFHWMAPPTSIPSKSSIMVSDATSRPFCACVCRRLYFLWLRESCTRSRLFPRQMPGLLDTDVRRKERRRGAHRITDQIRVVRLSLKIVGRRPHSAERNAGG